MTLDEAYASGDLEALLALADEARQHGSDLVVSPSCEAYSLEGDVSSDALLRSINRLGGGNGSGIRGEGDPGGLETGAPPDGEWPITGIPSLDSLTQGIAQGQLVPTLSALGSSFGQATGTLDAFNQASLQQELRQILTPRRVRRP